MEEEKKEIKRRGDQPAPVRALAPSDGRPRQKNGKHRSSSWEHNHAVITEAYIALIEEKKRRPKIVEVAEKCGLNSRTIELHLKELKFQPIEHPLRVLTEGVVLAICKSAVEGNAASQKLWMQVMEGWRESNIVEAQVDHTVSDTPFSIKVHRAKDKA